MPRMFFLWAWISFVAAFGPAPQALAALDKDAPIACNTGEEARLLITVSGVRSSRGTITIMLYDDRDDLFLKKGGRIARLRAPAQKGETHACLPVPAPGSYAVSLYHDEDANKKLTKNWLGVPSEGYGFSKDAPVKLRLPELDEAVFTALPGETAVHIKMRY